MGDVDFLIAPPPQAELSASQVLQAVLNALLHQNLITADLHPDKSDLFSRQLTFHLRRLKRHKEAAASWMGVCVSPLSETRRRIDIKVYLRPSLPFALNYFIGSKDFVRALRYWCNTPTKETAQLASRLCAGANAFHLSDYGLFPISRPSFRSATRLRSAPLTPSVPCLAESEIFRSVGLDYVPPWMRHFSSS